jgi:hypothetical protein
MRRLVTVIITDPKEGDSWWFKWITDDPKLMVELLASDRKPEELQRIVLDCNNSWDFKQGEEAKDK